MMGHNICYKGVLWKIIPFTPCHVQLCCAVIIFNLTAIKNLRLSEIDIS